MLIHLHHENCSEHQDVDFHVLLAEPMVAVAEVHQDVDFHVLAELTAEFQAPNNEQVGICHQYIFF